MTTPHRSEQESSDRLQREAAFHDTRFAADTRAATDRFYTITAASFAHYRARVLADVAGLDVLEYGCGTGAAAYEVAARGGRATGIDISPVAIDIARAQARARGLDANARFEVMNAEALAFPDASFDRICGSGILHHLDLDRAYPEIARVLRPGGYGVFLEPLGHNPLINWYRRRTPDLRTEDEHPLMRADLTRARRYFRRVDVRCFHLAALAAVPFRGTRLMRPLLAALLAADRLLLARRSPLRYQAWMVVMELRR
ncbi:methyltransferase type 11 [Mizugakiibacter sediminis]|uniref:Methyltransferase type 11 n=1 Tax=Mizugakiibacter sediminis TaxID=1475481 RepID=A0A0K8QN94_9GAMM|nr:class I SAM-dependent methyltransferase [Mizugakiibacter sediminis]GAP66354.1 methyltransferase type 11 [Mizugakiibacter sediminis]